MRIHLDATPLDGRPRPRGYALGSSLFSRPYSGNPCWFLFLRLLICLNWAGHLPTDEVQCTAKALSFAQATPAAAVPPLPSAARAGPLHRPSALRQAVVGWLVAVSPRLARGSLVVGLGRRRADHDSSPARLKDKGGVAAGRPAASRKASPQQGGRRPRPTVGGTISLSPAGLGPAACPRFLAPPSPNPWDRACARQRAFLSRPPSPPCPPLARPQRSRLLAEARPLKTPAPGPPQSRGRARPAAGRPGRPLASARGNGGTPELPPSRPPSPPCRYNQPANNSLLLLNVPCLSHSCACCAQNCHQQTCGARPSPRDWSLRGTGPAASRLAGRLRPELPTASAGAGHRARASSPGPWPAALADESPFTDTRLGVATTLASAVAAMCVQLVDASYNLAIHMLTRSLLRSSSTHEPSDPPLEVVCVFLVSWVR